MPSIVSRLLSSFDPGERARLLGFFAAVIALHVAGWGMLAAVAPEYPALIGLGGLAYSFGLRHAFDADHISAIDNTTRKLLQEGGRPMGVGFFFSLGHSTVVFVIAMSIGFAMKAIVEGIVSENGEIRHLGGLIGTSVSGVFLILIGILNLIIFLDILSVYRRMHRGHFDRATLEGELVSGGVLTRIFSRMFKVITASWQMFPIGFLFGLGFDTASEVALLAVSAGAASQGLSVIGLMSLPLIFAAAMSLMDTTDGAFMAKAYSWAFAHPVRKLFYNITMTGLSVFVALFVGIIELLQVFSRQLDLDGGFWSSVNDLDIGSLGFVIVGAFVLTWVGAFVFFRMRRVEERWSALVPD